MWVCYLLVNNFGWAIILFTLLVKAAMFPLNLKQQKNMAKSQLFAPRVKEIQQKYRNNREKQQEEMTKLQQEGYNPMGGCGSMLLTFLILFGVIDVVYKPMTHMEHLDWGNSGAIETITSTAKSAEYASVILTSPEDTKVVLDFLGGNETALTLIADNVDTAENESNQIVISVAEGEVFDISTLKNEIALTSAEYKDSYDKLKALTDDQIGKLVDGTSRISAEVKNALNSVRTTYSSSLYKELNALNTYRNHTDVFQNLGLSSEVLEKLDRLNNNMEFAGINLGLTPSFSWNILIIVPILSFLMSIIQTIVTQYVSKRSNPSAAQMGGGMKAFMYIMPLFSLYIAFIVPAGVGFYWTISYFFGIVQSVVTYKVWPPEKLQARAAEELKAKKINLSATAVVVDVDENGNEVKSTVKMAELSQKDLKEYQRKKLEEARRVDAEKYGDEDIPDLPPIVEKTPETDNARGADNAEDEKNKTERTDK